MSLPWFRVDVGIGSHDKFLALTSDRSPHRWRAAWSYVCALGWSVEHETDGFIPRAALPHVAGTDSTARLLVAYQLWEPTGVGWEIRNFADRQATAKTNAAKRDAARRAAQIRWNREKGRTS
jgi:hypothetical protein